VGDLQSVLSERKWRRYFPKTQDPEVLHAAFIAFVTECWYISVPGKRLLFPITPEQSEAARRWITHRYCINLKARQIGYSTLVGAFSFWETFGYDNRKTILVSKGEHEAQVLLQKTKYGIRLLPKWLLSRGPNILTNNTEKVAFDNDSSIESLPSKDDPARGETAWRIFVDEFGKLPNAEEAWASIEPVVDVDGRFVGLGTANGWGTFYHSMWVAAELGENGFDHYFAPWSAAKHRDADWYTAQEKKFKNTPWILHQEYPRNAAEAFMKSGNMVFDLDLLVKQEQHEAKPQRHNMLVVSPRKFTLTGDVEGSLRVWEKPRKGERYVIGADIAEGESHGDYSVAQILHAKTGEQVAMWHGHIDPDLFGEEILPALGWWYGTALIVPENNNMGISTIKALQRVKYPLLYRTLRLQDRAEHETEMFGFRTTRATKPFIISELNASLREDSIVIHDRETLVELKTYVRDDKGRMGGSPHDDRVMSLALAQEARRHVWLDEYRPPSEKPGKGTFAHMVGLLDKAAKELVPKQRPLGANNVRDTW
jgi:hypothetical protein